MALTRQLGGLSIQLLRNKACLYAAVRCSSDKPEPWNYIWAPKKYSEKDHDKIAEKYHLHPKDYKPYPETEKYVGDYPNLPKIGSDVKDPYYPYDIPMLRKNYHETMHLNYEIISSDRYDYGAKYRINPFLGSAIFVASIVTLAVLAYALAPYPTIHPRMERQFPQKGVVHYTFEPADS